MCPKKKDLTIMRDCALTISRVDASSDEIVKLLLRIPAQEYKLLGQVLRNRFVKIIIQLTYAPCLCVCILQQRTKVNVCAWLVLRMGRAGWAGSGGWVRGWMREGSCVPRLEESVGGREEGHHSRSH